jgi:hypothetical protein
MVGARDKEKTATFFTEMRGLPPHTRVGHFAVVRVSETSLDFGETDAPLEPRHFAFYAERDQAKKTSADFLLIQGATLGFFLCGLFSASMHLLMPALYLIFYSRKERLLIEYSKRVQNIR